MIRCEELVQEYVRTLEGEFRCQELSENRLMMATPYTYVDGDVLEVIVELAHESLVLSDGGEALSRVRMSGANIDSPSARHHLRSILSGYRTDILGSELRVEGSHSDFPSLFLRIIGTMRDADALRLLQPSPRQPLFETRVLRHLHSLETEAEDRPRRQGRSGTTYRLTAAVQRPRNALVLSAAGGRSETGIRAVNYAFRAFSDIDGSLTAKEKLVVISDEREGWRSEDISLLTTVSYVAAWWDLVQLDAFLQGEVPDDRRLFASQSRLV